LYPIDPPFTEPIIPAGTEWDFKPLKAIPPKFSVSNKVSNQHPSIIEPTRNLGSNNWAVSGSKSESGNPMLCNDPHLGLTLPSIWFEIQLVSPSVNVYGVTLPGAPAVVIGFNDRVAWGMTNAETDVLDWYDIKFRDSTRSEYRFASGWRSTSIRVDTIKVYGDDPIIDTTILTHQGPVLYDKGMTPDDPDIPVGAAMRWSGTEPSEELLTLLDLNRAKNYDDYIAALKHYSCPAQNFAFACADGDIAICQKGRFPVRWPGQGRFIMDGADSLNDWQAWIPRDQLPQMRNPERGFVCSSNQRPVDLSYPYYMDGNYAPYSRSARIDELLMAKNGLSSQDMMRIQTDVLSPNARNLVPVMLPLVDATRLDSTESYCLSELTSWDFRYTPESRAATIYEYWFGEMSTMIWQDEFPADDTDIRYPRQDVTEKIILTEPDSPYIDDHTTPKHENLADILNASFAEAAKSLVEARGGPGTEWEWGRVKPLNIRHLAQIPGLGRDDLPSGGWWSTVDAVIGNTGPSWRMIVQTGDSLRAWGVYPGGQSGNPGSPYYDDGVDLWLAGGYRPLLYIRSSSEKSERIVETSVLRGAK
jgi:penicillin amidase